MPKDVELRAALSLLLKRLSDAQGLYDRGGMSNEAWGACRRVAEVAQQNLIESERLVFSIVSSCKREGVAE